MVNFPSPAVAGNLGNGDPLILGDQDAIGDLFTPGSALEILDWDGDGKAELVSSGGTGDITVFKYLEDTIDGTPIFDRGTMWGELSRSNHRDDNDKGLTGSVIAAADFDGDGVIEVILAPRGYSKKPIVVFKLNSAAPTTRADQQQPNFVEPENMAGSVNARSAAVCDWNGDGKPDLVVCKEIKEGSYIDKKTGVAPEDQRDRFAHYVRIEMAKQDNDKILEEKAKILSTLDDLNRTPGDVVDAVVADVPDPIQAIRNQDIDEFEAELVAHLLDKRFDVVSKQYDRTGKPKINPEDHGLDKDSLIAAIQNDDITPIKSQLESFFQSALRLGEGNTFQGVDGWEFRILNRNGETPVLDYSGRQGRLDVSLGSSEGKIWYRKRNRNGTWTDWSNDQGGYTKRTISFKVSDDGTLQIDPQNRMMFPSGNGSKLKGSGFATFFNYNAFLHWKQLGAEKVHVTTSTDGPVFWAMQGFDNPDVTKRVLKRLKDAIDNNDMNTPIQTDEQRERMLRIWEMHQSGRPVNMLMIHSALKWDGKHDWEKLSISRNADGTYKKARRNLGIAKTRYGQWFLDNGRMSEGWFHLGDETPIGKYLNGIIGNIGNMDEIDDNIADPWGGRGAYVVNNGRVVRGPVRASIGGSQLGTNDRLYPVTDPVVIGDLERRGLRPMTAIGQNDRDQLVAGAR